MLLPHSADFWVAILACMTTGRALMALDWHHPASRNADIISRADWRR
jgi:hypothetical protein